LLIPVKDRSAVSKESHSLFLKNTPNIVDVLLGRENIQIVDSETLIKNVQQRVLNALKHGYQYQSATKQSEEFLRKRVLVKVKMVVMYVDLVGSTRLTMTLPNEQLATIVSSFAQEMAYVIREQDGFVLKFVGDAVIGYFVEENDMEKLTDKSVSCAESMMHAVNMGINPILATNGLPELRIKIGLDFGENTIVRYGEDEKLSHVDLLGNSMNIAAKIQRSAKPGQIIIGHDVYIRLSPTIKGFFKETTKKIRQWNYKTKTGKIYQVYSYVKHTSYYDEKLKKSSSSN